MQDKYIYQCECGYRGPSKWVKEIEKVDGGHWEKEYLGCPKCKAHIHSDKMKLVKPKYKEELDNE